MLFRSLFGPLCLQGVADPARGGPSQQRSHRLHGPVRGHSGSSRLLAALLGIALGQALDLPVLDGVASLVIGLILALTAGFLAYECQSLLTGEGVDPEVRASIRAVATSEPDVVRLNEALTMHFGPPGCACRA